MSVMSSLGALFAVLLLAAVLANEGAAEPSDFQDVQYAYAGGEGDTSHTQPIADDSQFEGLDNKFLDRDLEKFENWMFKNSGQQHTDPESQCNHFIHMRWMSEVDGSIYSTPVITDALSDGKKEILASTFVHYLELLEGSDGHPLPGWPFTFPQSSFHTSPILVDVDHDGVQDYLLSTFNGEIVFVKDNGLPLFGNTLRVPKLRVRKGWYVGLRDEHNTPLEDPPKHAEAQAYEDGSEELDGAVPVPTEATQEPAPTPDESIPQATETAARRRLLQEADEPSPTEGGESEEGEERADDETAMKELEETLKARTEGGDGQTYEAEIDEPYRAPEGGSEAGESEYAKQYESQYENAYEGEKVPEDQPWIDEEPADDEVAVDEEDEHSLKFGPKMDTWHGLSGWLSEDAKESLNLFKEPSETAPTVVDLRNDALRDPIFASLVGLNKDIDEMAEAAQEGFVFVDAHILCTPVVADLDQDGTLELIVAVSYYFDREKYQDPKAYRLLGTDVDITKYVAGGIVVFDLSGDPMHELSTPKWSIHLDLTTDHTKYRAYIYSSPTVADVDGDGFLEIVLGTSVGFIYVLEHDGQVKPGFPIQMAEIQGSVGVADINNDGKLELIAADSRHNVACYTSEGVELWERRISGFSAQGPSIGDLNYDGYPDVVFATTAGHIWAFDGKDGKDLPNFPVKLGGRVLSPVLLTHITGGVGYLQVVVPAHDGHLYIVDPVKGCQDRIDIGENTYSMVLADDLTGDGYIDLVVTTMNGNVYLFETATPYTPLRTWTSRDLGRNGFAVRDSHHGIYALSSSRQFRDIIGGTFSLQFEIVDKRPVIPGHQRFYTVKITLGGQLDLIHPVNYTSPGVYTIEVDCPLQRMHGTVVLEMNNEFLQTFTDSFALSFNVHFYKMLKWLAVVPFIIMSLVLLVVKKIEVSALPT